MEQKNIFVPLNKISSILLRLRRVLSEEPFKSIVEPELHVELRTIYSAIFRTCRTEKPVYISVDIFENLTSIISKLENVKFRGELGNDIKLEIHKILGELDIILILLKKELSVRLNIRPTVYNSEKYYKDQIKQLELQKKSLEEELKEKQEESKINQERTTEEINEKEEELRKAEEQIRNYQLELEEKKKQENAISEWRAKIKTTFVDLSGYLSPIKDEHQRLKYLYRTYAALTGIVVIFIVVLEIIICCKFSSTESFPGWKDHLILLLPIPASGALLWAFISQLNRAQRQLVLLAKHIHEIEYTEGLLLSLNSLSIDMEDSMKRVNSAIDRLLDNHLSMGIEVCRCDEDSIIKEEKKDMVPVDLILKLIKEVKGVALS